MFFGNFKTLVELENINNAATIIEKEIFLVYFGLI